MKKNNIIREWVESILIAALLAIFVKTFFFQVYKIPTGSMIPTLMPGDKIFVTKLLYGPKVPFTKFRLPGFRDPKRGEVVVFIPPHEKANPYFKRKHFIKRLIGLEGEHITIKNGNVYVNGEIVINPVIAKNRYTNDGPLGKKEMVVPKDSYLFLGDNSSNSSDSRFWGFVNKEDIIGKALFIWFPPGRIGMIE